MKDEEIIDHAKKILREKGITGRMEMQKADEALYTILTRRKLLDEVGFEEKRRKKRHWDQIKDEEMIEFSRRYIKEKGMSRRIELQRADPGLYHALGKRKLLDRIGFEEKRQRRPWKEMKDEEIVEHAEKFMKENGIRMRSELRETDQGLYDVLSRRKLLNLVFSPIEKSQSERAIEQIIDFTAEFGERG